MKVELRAGRWYAYEMFPGYTGGDFCPYHSPIYVYDVQPLKTGHGKLHLRFWNAGYAAGVQDFALDLKVLYRAEQYLLADLSYDGRCVAIGELSDEWLSRYQPEILRGSQADLQSAVAVFYGVRLVSVEEPDQG